MAKKRDNEKSLSEKLSLLIQTKPSTVDSDDDDLVTPDKIASNRIDSDYSADELDVSKFRRINNDLLEEDDKKYSGKGVSRKDLDDSLDSDASKADVEYPDESQDSPVESTFSDHETEDDEEAESETGSQQAESDEDNITNSTQTKHGNDNFNKEIFLKAASDIEKGRAIKNQLFLWDFLLECRMKFQKCLLASNQLPNHCNFNKFKIKGDSLFQNSVVQCKKSLRHLLKSLLALQNVLLNSNEDFLRFNNNEKSNVIDSNDEEISSDSESDVKRKVSDTSFKKFKNLNDFSSEISKRHLEFLSYRNSTIQKWNDRTRIGYISNKNFSAFEQSTLKQIEHVLLDKQRLIKRTQTKRSGYHILGENDEEPPIKKANFQSNEDLLTISTTDKNKELHKEIFDDDDFYHQLLNEMVKRKANDVTDPVQLGRHWMQLQKIRNKMKKTVDTKASKGRKVRFVVHPKLVNFMMPINSLNYNEDAKTELFNSLFGNTKK